MTDYYVGSGGNDGNSGLTWALRKLTLNGAEDVPVAAGDDVYVGPGVYRETLTLDVSGGNVYNAGTVTVTNGSTTVTGAGTAFLANVAIADMFHNNFFASGADGVANGTATFTSAAGNFQAAMIGKVIQITGRNPYVIGAVAAANQITLVDVNVVGWPAAGVGLSYSVMSGEGPYEIDSVTDNTNFELIRPWCGPTLTGLSYLTYRPIRYIGDVTGENTDGVGGVVRITGSDNDTTIARTRVISGINKSYRLFRGLWLNLASNELVWVGATSAYWTFEDCALTELPSGNAGLNSNLMATPWALTMRRCFFKSLYLGIWLHPQGGVKTDDIAAVFENCVFVAMQNSTLQLLNIGGITVRNCFGMARTMTVNVQVSPNSGQTVDVRNCYFTACNPALKGNRAGDITEDFNDFFSNLADRLNTTVGANSQTYPILMQPPFLKAGYKMPWWFPALSEWSPLRAITGAFEPCNDMQGLGRPATSSKRSWGPVQFHDAERDTGTVYAGAASMELLDAGRIQFKVPCTNRAYIVRVRVYREANYAGVNPQVIIKQPDQADRTTTDAGAAGAWNLLEDTFTPAADPEYFIVELVSSNTAMAGNYATYFDNLEVRGEPQQPGEFEHWMWDRQPFETLPADALVVRGREYRRRRVPGEVSAMEEQ